MFISNLSFLKLAVCNKTTRPYRLLGISTSIGALSVDTSVSIVSNPNPVERTLGVGKVIPNTVHSRKTLHSFVRRKSYH